MTSLLIDDTITMERHGALRIYHRRALAPGAILEALESPGEALKVSGKSVTRRVGSWVVKQSRPQAGLGILKRTVQRSRYRRGWIAGNFLERRGILVPRPHAFVEKGRFGLLIASALICDYLDGCRNVEEHAAQLAEKTVTAFLARLADAVNALTTTGAYHTDLSGKNIFTRKGETFYFIDLEGIVLEGLYSDSRRMENHVQLYDSFCDLWPPELLDPFIVRMLHKTEDEASWIRAVHENQKARRAKHDRKTIGQD